MRYSKIFFSSGGLRRCIQVDMYNFLLLLRCLLLAHRPCRPRRSMTYRVNVFLASRPCLPHRSRTCRANFSRKGRLLIRSQ